MGKRRDRERAGGGLLFRGGKLVHINDVEEEKKRRLNEQELGRAEFHRVMTVIGSQLFRLRSRH